MRLALARGPDGCVFARVGLMSLEKIAAANVGLFDAANESTTCEYCCVRPIWERKHSHSYNDGLSNNNDEKNNCVQF